MYVLIATLRQRTTCKQTIPKINSLTGRNMQKHAVHVSDTMLNVKEAGPPKKKRGRPPVPPTKAVENEFSIVAQAVIQRPLTDPVTQDMERVAAHIIKSKMHQSGGIVTELSTGTQVIIFIN